MSTDWIKPGAPVRLEVDGDVLTGHLSDGQAVPRSNGEPLYHVTYRQGGRVMFTCATLDELQPIVRRNP